MRSFFIYHRFFARKAFSVSLAILSSIIFHHSSFGQSFEPDGVGVHSSGAISLLLIDVPNESYLYGPSGSQLGQGNEVRETVFTAVTHLGVRIPIRKKENYIMGLRINAGIGRHSPISSGERFNSFVLDFPVYAYVRSVDWKVNLSFLAGYKYSHLFNSFYRESMGIHYPLLAVDFHIYGSDQYILRLFGSPVPFQKNEQLNSFSQQRLFSLREFGVGFVRSF